MVRNRVTFRIVEVSESEFDFDKYYEDFRVDFLNPLISVDGLMEKYPIPKYKYKEWSKRIKDEEGLSKKPVYTCSVNKVGIDGLRENQNIYRLANCYGISKHFHGVRKYFGKYPDVETARKVRNILYQSDWDEALVPELMEKFGYSKEQTVYEKAMEYYDDFKKLYVGNPPTKYTDILKKLNITPSMYSVLVSAIKKENPHIKKTRYYCYGNRKLKPVGRKKRKKRVREMRYITHQPDGAYTVSKHIDGVHKSFGTFHSKSEAIKRRDYLEANGWKR